MLQILWVLRRTDNLNPVGFYLMYPTAPGADANFFISPSKSLHLSAIGDVDPFVMAASGDRDCVSIFIRSWAILQGRGSANEREYLDRYRVPLLIDCQQTLTAMQQDFPNLCDLYTMIIHPSYEQQASALGFQFMSRDRQLSLYGVKTRYAQKLSPAILNTSLR